MKPGLTFRAEMNLAVGQSVARDIDARIGENERSAMGGRKSRSSTAAYAESDHHHAFSAKICHRNLSVLSATRAHTIEIIQNRVTTTVSGHPPSSK